MQRLRTILSITAVRLSIVYTLVFGFVAVVIVLYMTGATANLLRRQIRESINIEMVQLDRIYAQSGINGLIRQLERRAAAPGANLYVIAAPTGSIIAGNVDEIETEVLGRIGWTFRPFEYSRFSADGQSRHAAVARVSELPNGMRILVGRDLGEPEKFRSLVARALILSIGAMLLVGLLTWVLVGRRALKRVELVSQSTNRILSGERHVRLPVTGSGDEFDRLSSGLNSMLDRIGLLDEGLRQVSDNIAHDLKTPLTRLRNKADAAMIASGANQQQALQEIIADTDQIIRTFNALLMISRVESGSSAAELSSEDFSAIILDVAELYEPVAEEEGFVFETSIEPGLKVRGNRELLAQAVSNLADNAIKYGRSDNNLARISFTLGREGEHAVLSIADAGPGIPAQDRQKVTERFARLEQSRSRPGNGLGLSLVAAVAQLHSGMLEFADNEPGLKAILRIPLEKKIRGAGE